MALVDSTSKRSTWMWALAAVGGVALVWLLGSWLYWAGSGKPGTPADFRREVADTGLAITWSNNGPTAGTGTVATSCGPAEVEVNELDGELWIRWDDNREPIGAEVIDGLMSCD